MVCLCSIWGGGLLVRLKVEVYRWVFCSSILGSGLWG